MDFNVTWYATFFNMISDSILQVLRQQPPHGIAYAKPPVIKGRLNLVTGSTLPQMES